MGFAVCSVCDTQYPSLPEARCPGCTAPVQLARRPVVPFVHTPQRWGVLLLLAANALLLGAHGLWLREPPPPLFVVAGVDAVLAALLWLRLPPAAERLVLMRAGVGLFFVWRLLRLEDFPVLVLPQAALCGALVPLALLRSPRPSWLSASLGLASYAVLAVAVVHSLATGSAHLEGAVRQYQGQLGTEPVAVVKGRAEPYTLPLPGGPWFPASAARLEELDADALLYDASHGVELAVFALRIPGLGAVGMDVLEPRLRTQMKSFRPDFEWTASRELPGVWDEGRMVRLRGRMDGFMREAALAIYIWGDRLFLIEASAPSWRSQDPLPRLEALVGAFQYATPPRPFLSAEIAQRVAQATVMVRTPSGSGSGFVIRTEEGYRILTNHHVLRDAEGRGLERDVRILFPSDRRGERAAQIMNVDARADLALLLLPPTGTPIPALPLRVKTPAKNTPLVASGYPFGEEFRSGAAHPRPTLSPGSVLDPSAAPPPIYPDASARILLTDLGVNPGNSGGPVVDLEGAVVGMVVAGYLGSESSFVIPAQSLSRFAGSYARRLDAPSPGAPKGARPSEPLAEPARSTLSAATVSVGLGEHRAVGVVLDVPGFGKGLVLTLAARAKSGDPVDVDFFSEGAAAPQTHPGTVRTLLRHGVTDLALVEVPDFPGLPRGLSLPEGLDPKETDALVLGGFRDVQEGRIPISRPGILTGIERAERWDYGAQEVSSLRVDMGTGRTLHPGPVVDREGRLVGFVTRHLSDTNIAELVPSDRLRELLGGRVSVVAARARRELTGACQVDFFVEAPGPLTAPRTVSLAVDSPQLGLEGTSLAPSFGAEQPLGTLASGESLLHLELTPCPTTRLVYRLQLTSALTVQRVEGYLPLPTRALERTQARVPLQPAPARTNWALKEFLEWKGETSPLAPQTPQAAVAACARSSTACGFVTALHLEGAARKRLLRELQGACRKGQASACLGWAEEVDRTAPEAPRIEGRIAPGSTQDELAQGCDKGLPEACELLSQVLVKPGVERNWRSASYLLRLACLRDSRYGCQGLTGLLAVERGAPLNKKPLLPEVRQALSLACEGGVAEACSRLGERLMRQGDQRPLNESRREDWFPAVEALRKGCLGGSAGGCSGLAGALAVGHGVARDETRSLRAYVQACRLHDDAACMMGGYIHQGVFDVPGSQEEASGAFQQACVLGEPRGCFEMVRAMDPVPALSGFTEWPELRAVQEP